jgi:RNA polymerase sigma-70 factor (ECF subfamily)
MRAPMVDPDDAIVSEVVAACASTWPDVRVDGALVAERLGRLDGAVADFELPRLAELCLVAACLARDPAAQRAIDRLIHAEAQRAVTELRQPAWRVDDVHQELSQRLLVGAANGDGGPRLASYAGQAALGRWLGVAALRTAINLTRRDKPETPIEETDVAAVFVPPELAVVRDRYRDEVEAAIRAAFAAIDNPRDRNLLRLYYLERVGLDQLGQMFAVHGSTVSRWLSALREAIVDDTRERLAEQLGMAGNFADVDSLIRAVRSELDLTLSRILRVRA